MKLTFSGNKDIDRCILLFLPDKDLLTVCRLNKYLYNVVCDDNFYYNKLLKSYPDTLKYWDNGYRTYTQFYLTMISYIFKLEKEFNYAYVKGNPEVQYRLFHYNRDSQRLLNKSIKVKELELVKESIKRGAYINGYDSHTLSLAIEVKDLEIFKYLFTHETNSHRDDQNLLRYAIENGYLEIVKYLVQFGLNIDLYNDISLLRAGLRGHQEVVNYFTERGARIDQDGYNTVVLLDFTGV